MRFTQSGGYERQHQTLANAEHAVRTGSREPFGGGKNATLYSVGRFRAVAPKADKLVPVPGRAKTPPFPTDWLSKSLCRRCPVANGELAATFAKGKGDRPRALFLDAFVHRPFEYDLIRRRREIAARRGNSYNFVPCHESTPVVPPSKLAERLDRL